MEEKNKIEPVAPASDSKTLRTIVTTVIVTVLVLGIVFFTWSVTTSQNKMQQQIANLENQSKQNQQNNQPSPQPTNQTADISPLPTSGTPAVINTAPTQAAGLSSLDQTWNLYTNTNYGFTIKVPKQMYHMYGSMCEWQTDSYRPKGGLVPVKIFEDENIYISSEYYYELTGKTEKDNHTLFSGCDKVTNTISLLKDEANFQQQKWKFVIKDVANDTQLESFIKDRYGSGCKLGNKTPSSQQGVFSVSVQGDGLDLGETACPLNYITVLKYYPAKNKAVSWNLGQASTFAAAANFQTVYDQEMVDSFRFL